MLRIFRYTFACLIGAVIAWAIMEPTPLMPNTETVIPYGYIFAIGLLAGLGIGTALGIAEAKNAFSSSAAIKTILTSAAFGAGGGIVGLTIGNAVYNSFDLLSQNPSAFSFALKLIGRSSGWSLIGLFVGLSLGVSSGNPKKMINGMVGGFLGGGIGGTTFEILAMMNRGGVANFPTGMIRLVSFAITGASIGFCIGCIEELTKQAWLIRLYGRNEGKEYTIFKPITIIGRNELAEVPVFDDPDIDIKHASIVVKGSRRFIKDEGSNYGILLNGVKVSDEMLNDGDLITIGKTKFEYHDKASSRLAAYSDKPKTQSPVNSRICQFCGEVKDSNGNCKCSLSGSSPFDNQSQVQAPVSMPTYSPATSQMMAASARLAATSGPYAGSEFPIPPNGAIIGRDASADISLSSDNTVSRNHANIKINNDVVVLIDNNSSNGTYVNNIKITSKELINGDLVQIGSTKFRFEA